MVFTIGFPARTPEKIPDTHQGNTGIHGRTGIERTSSRRESGRASFLKPKIGEIPDAWNRRCIPYRFYPL